MYAVKALVRHANSEKNLYTAQATRNSAKRNIMLLTALCSTLKCLSKCFANVQSRPRDLPQDTNPETQMLFESFLQADLTEKRVIKNQTTKAGTRKDKEQPQTPLYPR